MERVGYLLPFEICFDIVVQIHSRVQGYLSSRWREWEQDILERCQIAGSGHKLDLKIRGSSRGMCPSTQ